MLTGPRQALPRHVRVCVIEPDASIRTALATRFAELGWHVETLAAPVPPSALIPLRLHALSLDIETLGPQVWSYLDRLTDELPDLAVVVCTGRTTVAQRVRGLGLGVDDWVTKPFHPEELAARLEAVIRRRRRLESQQASKLSVGELELELQERQVFAGGKSVGLTPREFDVLLALAEAEGQVVPREEIYQRVWGYAMVAGDRSVDVFIRKIRRKLEAASPGWHYLHTTFGVGYRCSAERKT